MRLWVRLGKRINLSPRFSWTIAATPDTPKSEVLFQSFDRFSRQTDSAVISVFVLMTVKKNRELFQGAALASRGSFASPQKYPCPSTGILTGFPFDSPGNIGTERVRGPAGPREGSRPAYCPLFIRNYPIS